MNVIFETPWLWPVIGLVTLLLLVGFYAGRFEKVGPNEVLIVSGRPTQYTSLDGQRTIKNFRIYHGGGTFVWPIRERVDRLNLELMTLEIRTPEFYTKFGVPIIVDGIAQIKVRSDDTTALITAAEMFLSKSRIEMNEIALQMMSGHLRSVISTLPFEEIHSSPETFAQTVQRLTAEDLANMGIQVISFTIREIQDPQGYLRAIGRPKMADVQKNAVLGEANAGRDSTIGQSLAEREATLTSVKAQEESQLARIAVEVSVAEAQKEKDLRLRQFEAEVSTARAETDIAYELERARRQQALAEETLGISLVEKNKQIQVEQAEIERRERELVHTVQKPALAERERMAILAGAEGERRKVEAAAEAEARKMQGMAEAEVIRAKGQAEAESIKLKALAEAEGLMAKLHAEAEGMQEKAKAYQQYNDAAVVHMLIDRMPEIAAAVSAPLSKIDRITMVQSGSSGGEGVEKITKGVADVLHQMPGIIETVSGLDLKEMIGKATANGKSLVVKPKT